MKKVLLILFSLFVSVSAFADIEVVVTASRLDEDPGTVPATMHIITEDELETSRTLLDALNGVPGIHILSNSGGGNGTYLSMGGFGENSFGRVLVMIDGIPVNRPDMASFNWLSIPFSRIERVEILKGSASSLYGDAAVAGVINIITSRPDRPSVRAGADIDTHLGNRETVSLEYGNDVTDIGISASRRSDRTSRARTDADMLSAGVEFGLRPMEGLEFSLSGDYTTSSYQMPGGLTPDAYAADPDQAVNTADAAAENLTSVRFFPGFENDFLSISSPVSFSRTDTDTDFSSYYSFSTTLLDTLIIAPQVSLFLPLGQSIHNTVTLGSDIRMSRITVDRYPTAEKVLSSFTARAARSSYGIWLRDKALISDIVSLDGGIRYEQADTTASSEDDTGINGSAASSPLVFDVGVSFFPFMNLNLGIKYGTTYRYPFLDEQVSYLGYGYDTFYTDLDPESGQSLTASVEYSFGGITIELSPYLLIMDGEIVYDSTLMRNINSASRTLHCGGSLSAGYEHELVSFNAGYGIDRAEYTTGDLTGKVLPLVPLHQVDGTVTARLPGGMSLSSTVDYSSGFYLGGDYDNAQSMIPGRTNWDIVLVWEPQFFEGFRLTAAGRNILNDRTPTLAYYSSFSSTSSYYPTAGRSFELGASWTY